MKKLKHLLVVISVLIACNKNLEVGDILTNLTTDKEVVNADGQSIVEVSVEINQNSSEDRRVVIFTASSGVFSDSELNTYSSKAEFIDGKLIAKAMLKAPISPGQITITCQPEFDSPIKEYELSKKIEAIPSLPNSINLEASAFGLKSQFGNEVFLHAILKNSEGKHVSKNTMVLFEDLTSNTNANGRYREMQNATDENGKVSTYYSSNAYPVGTDIMIRVTVLDPSGIKTNLTDSILLTINQ